MTSAPGENAMSENLQLLQALARKPSVQDWFMQRFTVIHLDVTDTGEQFTLANLGDHAELLSGFTVPGPKRWSQKWRDTITVQ